MPHTEISGPVIRLWSGFKRKEKKKITLLIGTPRVGPEGETLPREIIHSALVFLKSFRVHFTLKYPLAYLE